MWVCVLGLCFVVTRLEGEEGRTVQVGERGRDVLVRLLLVLGVHGEAVRGVRHGGGCSCDCESGGW